MEQVKKVKGYLEPKVKVLSKEKLGEVYYGGKLVEAAIIYDHYTEVVSPVGKIALQSEAKRVRIDYGEQMVILGSVWGNFGLTASEDVQYKVVGRSVITYVTKADGSIAIETILKDYTTGEFCILDKPAKELAKSLITGETAGYSSDYVFEGVAINAEPAQRRKLALPEISG